MELKIDLEKLREENGSLKSMYSDSVENCNRLETLLKDEKIKYGKEVVAVEQELKTVKEREEMANNKHHYTLNKGYFRSL